MSTWPRLSAATGPRAVWTCPSCGSEGLLPPKGKRARRRAGCQRRRPPRPGTANLPPAQEPGRPQGLGHARHGTEQRYTIGVVPVAGRRPPLVHLDEAGLDELKADEPASDLGAVAQADRHRPDLVPPSGGERQPVIPDRV